LLEELAITAIYLIFILFAFLLRTEYSVILKNSISELVSNFNIIPFRRAVIQDIIAISVFLDYCLRELAEYIKFIERNKSIETELNMSESYNEIAQVRIREVRKLKHDIKEHINVAYALCKDKDYLKLESYLEELGAQTDALPTISYCNSTPCNHILVYYSEKSKKSDINFRVSANVGESIGLSDSEATSLLSNLLRNAYEACIACKNTGIDSPYISFSMNIRKNKLYISCENSCISNAQKDEHGRFVTGKSNSVEHGLGIAIVESICESHNGAAIFDLKDNRFIANATIPIELT
jgi:sensor histidine kinase regulating citrate/malate metabolism